MTHQTIRRIESWVGRPLCALLTLHRWIAERIGWTRDASRPPGRILFIKLVEQGSTVLAAGALRRAIEQVGASNVYFCAFHENRAIVDLMALIPPENVIAIRAESFAQFCLDALRAMRHLRGLRVDATVDLEFFARASAIIAYVSGAPRRVGMHRYTSEGGYRGDLMTHRLAYNPYLHVAKTFRLLVDALAFDVRDAPLAKVPPPDSPLPASGFEPAEPERDDILRRLQAAAGGSISHPIVLFNANAADRLPLRKWPAHRFVELGRDILTHHPTALLVLTGGTDECLGAEELRIALDSPRAINFAGRTSLRQLMVLYGLADVLITNDSGPAHFATLTPIASVVLFGPETPLLYGPLGAQAHTLWAGLACSPCVNAFNNRLSPCRKNVCMDAISVEQVYALVDGILRESKRLAVACA